MTRTADECSTEQVMDFLVRRRAPGSEPGWIADILGRLVWLTDDNGGEIEVVRRRWLRGDDRYRVEVALAMEEVFPADDRAVLAEVLGAVAKRWPDLAPRCEEWLRDWDAGHRGSDDA